MRSAPHLRLVRPPVRQSGAARPFRTEPPESWRLAEFGMAVLGLLLLAAMAWVEWQVTETIGANESGLGVPPDARGRCEP